MPETALASLATGCVLGLSAGAAPGPLLTLVITETLTCGPRAGMRIAVAPLFSDPPIILAVTLLLAELARFSWALALISLLGCAVVLQLSWQTWNAQPPVPGTTPQRNFSLRKGVITNLLNPHPYLFWLGVGSPMLMRGWKDGPQGPLLFLAGFYVSMVTAKIIIALLTARSRTFLRGRAYVLLLKGLALALAFFGLLLLRDAWNLFFSTLP
ncbi:MAG: LysE family translocator [Desulfovibrionaceae bacterium]